MSCDRSWSEGEEPEGTESLSTCNPQDRRPDIETDLVERLVAGVLHTLVEPAPVAAAASETGGPASVRGPSATRRHGPRGAELGTVNPVTGEAASRG
jgi:hypothetical protein